MPDITDYKLAAFTKKVADLADRPALTPDQLKAEFDAAPEELRGKFNSAIDYLFANYITKSDVTTNRKLSATGDFTGTLNGMPIVSAEPGLSSAVAALQADFAQWAIDVKKYGAKGDGVTDDTAAIQEAINDAYNNSIGLVFFPKGMYIVTKPLYLWGSVGYQTMGVKLFAQSVNSVIIKKTTHNTTGDGSGNDGLDAVIIISRYDKDTTKDCYRAEIENIYVDGMISSGDYTDYAVVTKTKSAEVRLTNCVLRAEICFQNKAMMWQSSFRDLMLYPVTRGFSMTASGTSNLIERTYVWGSSEKGFELMGDYSFANNLAVDQATGVCYDFNYANWTISGIGEESPNATKFINTTRTILKLSSITSFGVHTAGSTVFHIGANSNVALLSGTIGSIDASFTVDGKFIEKDAVNSFLTISNLSIYNTYLRNTATSGNSAGTVVSSPFNTPIRYRGSGHTPHIGFDRGDNASHVDSYNNTKKMFGKAIFLDCQQYPLTDSYGVDRQWDVKPGKGDVFLENDPLSNGTFAWVVNNEPATYMRDARFSKVPVVMSGTTAERPTVQLVVGQQYFDTTLGKPIWCKDKTSKIWVDAAGSTV